MCLPERDVPDRAIALTTLNKNMLDFLLMDNFKRNFHNRNKQTIGLRIPNLTLFIIIVVIIIIIIIVYQIIYFHCLFFLWIYHLNHYMDTVIPAMNIFSAEVLSLSWSTFILVRNKEIKFIIQSALWIQYQIYPSL